MIELDIFGVTGSIGTSALNILRNFPEKIHVNGVTIHSRITDLIQIIDEFNPSVAVVMDRTSMFNYFQADTYRYKNTDIYCGPEGMDILLEKSKSTMVINGIAGKSGLQPSIKILNAGKHLLIANKESLVCAGSILKKIAGEKKLSIIPVDSEHSAVFSLLQKTRPEDVKAIHLTASGGPFLRLDKDKWDSITIEDALNHPTWKMGSKITIDSATMANKGLEVIEAHELFGVNYDQIHVLIHPQSLIHSMVETQDGEYYAQIGPKDMSLPIMNAIFYPQIETNRFNHLDFSKGVKLELFPVDLTKFRMLDYAYLCGREGGLFPAFFNTVNEYLVGEFLASKISFLDIEYFTGKSLDHFYLTEYYRQKTLSLDLIDHVDEYAVDLLKKMIASITE